MDVRVLTFWMNQCLLIEKMHSFARMLYGILLAVWCTFAKDMRKLPRSCREEYGKHHMPSLHLLWKWHRNTKCSYLAIIMWNNEGVIEQIFFTLTIKKIATSHWSNIHDLSSSFQLWLGIGKRSGCTEVQIGRATKNYYRWISSNTYFSCCVLVSSMEDFKGSIFIIFYPSITSG